MSGPVWPRAVVCSHQHPTPHGSLPGATVVEASVIATRARAGEVDETPTAMTLEHMAELIARADRLGIARTAVILFEDTGPDVYRGRVRVTGAGVRAMVGETALRLPTGRTRSADLPCTCGHRQDQHRPSTEGGCTGPLVLPGHTDTCTCPSFALGGARADQQDREAAEALRTIVEAGQPAPALAPGAVCDRQFCRHEYGNHVGTAGSGGCTTTVLDGPGGVAATCSCTGFLAGGG